MKRKGRRKTAKSQAGKSQPGKSQAGEVFVRGFVATVLLSTLQDRAGGAARRDWRKVLRHGLQGGAALAAATIAAEAGSRRDFGTGVTAVLAGAVAVMAAEATLNPPQFQENSLGQEEA